MNAAMDESNERSKVTLDKEDRYRKTVDFSSLSQEEKAFYNLLFGGDIAAVRHGKIHCTACDAHIGSAPSQYKNMFVHPVLLTLLCAKCRSFYGDGHFEQGEDATDMFCRLCANGGNLYCCSYCSNTFCQKCIKRNFDPVVRKKIEDEESWKCFVCDPSDLYSARALCWALMQHIQTVTRILKTDETITNEDFEEKFNLDESKCCSRKRIKAKRRKLSLNISDDEVDETNHESIEDVSLSTRRKISKKTPRTSLTTNGDELASVLTKQSSIRPRTDRDSLNENEADDDGLLPAMIPCVQSMIEGESSETLNETLNSQNLTMPTLHINPIPTANLLKVTTPSLFNPIRTNSAKRKSKSALQPILPAPTANYLLMKNAATPKSSNTQNLQTVQYSSLPLRMPSREPNVPMVAIPNTNTKSSPLCARTLEYNSLQLRGPNVQHRGLRQTLSPRILLPKQRPAFTHGTEGRNEVRVIEIRSDSEDDKIEELVVKDKGQEGDHNSLPRNRHPFKKSSEANSKYPDPLYMPKTRDKMYNKVENEIELRTEEVRILFKMIGTKLRKVPLLHLPNHNHLRSTRVKTRRFHRAMTKAISTLSDLNDKVVHTYDNWRKLMLEESRKTRSDNNRSGNSKTVEEITETIPLDMICTNSASESDNDDESDSDDMLIRDQIKCTKSFQERDTIDTGCGEPIPTADKSVQAFDVVDRDYEKCIGHSVLTKIEYDPVDGSEILKPVIIPAEYNGKFEEQFIFYLQRREENEIETEDDKGIPNPNETPLKDLIEANSPFVLEMLESIDSPLAKGITNDLEVGVSDESGSGKENEGQSEPTNVVKELAKMVSELSEDLKTSTESETCLTKTHSEDGKKDRRKQILECHESEIDIAVQTLIEEDERSRSSSNDDDNSVSRHIKQIVIGEKKTISGYSEDECTIIE